MRREIKFDSGYDCIKFECKFKSDRCVPNGGGNHGRHGLEIRFYVYGEKGVIQFVLSTGWMPFSKPINNIGYISLPDDYIKNSSFMASDLGYHSYKPMWEGDTPLTDKCNLLGGKPCYYDGSSLNANNAFYVLVNAGEEALWEYLEAYYQATFEKGEYPEITQYPMKLRK